MSAPARTPRYIRQTLDLDQDDAELLNQLHLLEKLPKSEIIRRALRTFARKRGLGRRAKPTPSLIDNNV